MEIDVCVLFYLFVMGDWKGKETKEGEIAWRRKKERNGVGRNEGKENGRVREE